MYGIFREVQFGLQDGSRPLNTLLWSLDLIYEATGKHWKFSSGVLTYRYTREMRGQWQGGQLGTYCSSASDT